MDQRNLILAIALSVAILLIYQFVIVQPELERTQQAIQTEQTAQPKQPGQPGQPGQAPADQAPGAGTAPTLGAPSDGATATAPSQPGAAATGPRDRAAALVDEPRVAIDTPTLKGSIALVGARLDDLILTRYRETLEPDSPLIELLSPLGTARPYFARFGWAASDPDVPVPGDRTEWTADGEVLAPGRPVTLSWDNGQGLRFEMRFSVDDNYLFTVEQRVVNEAGREVGLAPFGLISRTGTPDVLGFYILHEGLLGVFDGTLKEVDYDDLQDEGRIDQPTTGGWIGITDKYWLTALVPDQSAQVQSRFVHNAPGGQDKYQTDFIYAPVTVADGATASQTSRLFAGAKRVTLLDRYEEQYGITHFDLAVDFGWFYFLTKPIFLALHYLDELVGNFGVAILILTVAIKLVFFPLANKSYRAMAKMRKLQPEMLRLRERFGDDKQRLNQEMMALYKKEGANPLSGCLPIVIQIPVFFALYKVMFVTIEMRQAPFFGWIQDLSAQDPTSILNGFGLLPWQVPSLGPLDIINIGLWPLFMGLTMFLQQRLNPQPPDPVQAKIFLAMPIIFTFLLAQFPAGLVIYWTWNNLLSILQQAIIMKRAGVPLGREATKT